MTLTTSPAPSWTSSATRAVVVTDGGAAHLTTDDGRWTLCGFGVAGLGHRRGLQPAAIRPGYRCTRSGCSHGWAEIA